MMNFVAGDLLGSDAGSSFALAMSYEALHRQHIVRDNFADTAGFACAMDDAKPERDASDQNCSDTARYT
jgi:hypothetical protein